MIKESIYVSMKPEHVKFRREQMRVNNYIENILPNPKIDAFVEELDKQGIHDTEERIKLIGDFIKSKKHRR